jgi:5'-methylthioadenosine phosphorylase
MKNASNTVGIIGGSGLGDVLAEKFTDTKNHDIDTPFGKPSCPVVTGFFAGKKIAFINRHGLGHKFSPSDVPYAANIYALKKLGVTTLIATAAVGSLRAEIEPKHLIIVDQFIDKTTMRQNSFFNGIAAVHAEMAEPTCPMLRDKLIAAANVSNLTAHNSGTYVCMEGPQFSTRAESLMHQKWGGDLIGMTAMPEAKLAREAQMCYALVAMASDYDCWKPNDSNKDKQALLEEIIGNLNQATENAISLIKAFLQDQQDICCEDCACRKSMALALWTSRDRISDSDYEKVRILFD